MSNPSDGSLLGKIAGYTEILAKDPKSTVFVPLAETYRQMGLLDDALEVVQKGIRSQPRYAPGYAALGRLQAARDAFGEAEQAFEKALEMDEESLAALRGLTRLRLRRRDRTGARDLLERIVALKPDDRTAREMLEKLGGTARSAETPAAEPPPTVAPSPSARRPVGERGEPISTPTIAEIYVRQGFPKRAMKVYRDLLKSDPHNETIRNKLVQLKEQIAKEETEGDRPSGDESAVQSGSAAELPAETAPVSVEAEMAAPKEGPTKNEKVQDALEGWLQSIRRRREHVR